jgi:YHS domain-containing protein
MKTNDKKHSTKKVYHYDPVCRRKINKHQATYIHNFKNEQFLLCCPICQAEFEKNQKNYMDIARRLDDKTHKRRA